MDVPDIDADLVGSFPEHLETERGNSAQSRNIRLAAIRSFIRHVAVDEPRVLHHCRKILQLPAMRRKRGTVTWLAEDGIEALAAAPGLSARYGRRDRALPVLAAQTGLRVSEPVGLGIRDVEPGRGAHVRCRGKGRKDRATPLRSDTVKVIEPRIHEQGNVANAPLFPGNRGGPLGRDAVERIVAKHCRTASETCPSLGEKKATPHALRHSRGDGVAERGCRLHGDRSLARA